MVCLLNKINLPFVWITPSGIKINQNYLAVKKYKYNCNLYKGSKPVTIQIPSDKIDSKRQRNGIIPNLIHSLDASVLALMANKFLSKQVSLFSVHDCFATTANNVELMAFLVREAFIGIYADKKYVDSLHDFILTYISNHYEIFQENGEEFILFDEKRIFIPQKIVLSDDDLPL